MKFSTSGRRLVRHLALVGALGTVSALVHATPVVDGILDKDYGVALATSPKDDLAVWVPTSVNDPADPIAKTMDSTALYVTNSGNALYIFVRLPYYSLQTAYGDWAVAVHLGGANDAIAIKNTTNDPYGMKVFYNYPSNANAIIKANFVSLANFGDGVNGWGYINTPNAALNGWNFTGTDYFGSAAAGKPTTTQTTFHSVGATGSEIAYVNGDGTGSSGGIEIKVPFVDFARDANLTAPVVGDVVKLQFYSSRRDGTGSNGHVRGAIDSEPFEESARWVSDGAGGRDYTQGILTQQVSYTIQSAITPMDVQSAAFVDPTHIKVQFADNLAAGATTASNYVLTDVTAGGTPIAVSAAAIDGTLLNQADLTTATMLPGHQLSLVVSNVQSSAGIVVAAPKNTATFYSGVPVTFNLYDPTDIYTTDGATVMTVTGPFINWTNNADGSGEVHLTLVDAATKHYQSAPFYIIPPGGNNIVEYKYRLPGITLGDPWNALQGSYNNNPDNRAMMVLPGTTSISTNDYAETTNNVNVTFNLTDNENRAAGNDVYIAGQYINGYNFRTIATLLKMTKTGAHTYTITVPVPQGYDRYKYFTGVTDTTDPTLLDPNYDLFSQPNLYVTIIGSGTPPTQTVNDVIGVAPPTAAQVLRVAAGLDAGPTPATGAAFLAMDKVVDGKITIADAVKLLKP